MEMAYTKANKYYEENQFDKALGLYMKVYKENQNDGKLAYRIGYCLYGIAENKTAIEYFKKSISLDYALESCNYLIGILYMEIGSYNKAGKYLEVAKELNPDDAEVLTNYALLLLKKGRNEFAEEYMKKALEIAPDNDVVRFNNVNFFYYMYTESKQLELVEDYIKSAPSEMNMYRTMYIYNLRQKNYLAALDSAREMNKLNPYDKETFSSLKSLERKCVPRKRLQNAAIIGGIALVCIFIWFLNLPFQYNILIIILGIYVYTQMNK